MKHGKLVVTIGVVLLACMFLVQGAIYAAKEKDPSEGTPIGSNTNVVDKEFLASNTTFLTTDLIGRLNADAAAVVNLAKVGAAASGDIVTDLKAYAIGLGSVRLAQVAVTSNVYEFSDTTINPLLFSEDYAVNQKDAFIPQVEGLAGGQIAVIIAITKTPEEIEAVAEIKEKIDAGKVIIVQATTDDSKGAFMELFRLDPQNNGLNLRALDKNNPAVLKALQGSV